DPGERVAAMLKLAGPAEIKRCWQHQSPEVALATRDAIKRGADRTRLMEACPEGLQTAMAAASLPAPARVRVALRQDLTAIDACPVIPPTKKSEDELPRIVWGRYDGGRIAHVDLADEWNRRVKRCPVTAGHVSSGRLVVENVSEAES